MKGLFKIKICDIDGRKLDSMTISKDADLDEAFARLKRKGWV